VSLYGQHPTDLLRMQRNVSYPFSQLIGLNQIPSCHPDNLRKLYVVCVGSKPDLISMVFCAEHALRTGNIYSDMSLYLVLCVVTLTASCDPAMPAHETKIPLKKIQKSMRAFRTRASIRYHSCPARTLTLTFQSHTSFLFRSHFLIDDQMMLSCVSLRYFYSLSNDAPGKLNG
jgi:hypothetical protein